MERFYVSVCRECGYGAFPERLLCPRCGGALWEHREAPEGIVEATTRLHRAPGRTCEKPVAIALVRVPAGPLVVARLERDVAAGERVELALDDRAPVARGRARGS